MSVMQILYTLKCHRYYNVTVDPAARRGHGQHRHVDRRHDPGDDTHVLRRLHSDHDRAPAQHRTAQRRHHRPRSRTGAFVSYFVRLLV